MGLEPCRVMRSGLSDQLPHSRITRLRFKKTAPARWVEVERGGEEERRRGGEEEERERREGRAEVHRRQGRHPRAKREMNGPHHRMCKAEAMLRIEGSKQWRTATREAMCRILMRARGLLGAAACMQMKATGDYPLCMPIPPTSSLCPTWLLAEVTRPVGAVHIHRTDKPSRVAILPAHLWGRNNAG